MLIASFYLETPFLDASLASSKQNVQRLDFKRPLKSIKRKIGHIKRNSHRMMSGCDVPNTKFRKLVSCYFQKQTDSAQQKKIQCFVGGHCSKWKRLKSHINGAGKGRRRKKIVTHISNEMPFYQLQHITNTQAQTHTHTYRFSIRINHARV